MNEELLTLANINKSFGGVHAVQSVSLAFKTGELTALIGPNGAGKTTLFNIISGDVLPDTGNIIFLGKNITHFPTPKKVRSGLCKTFQIASVMEGLTVRQNVQFALFSMRNKYFNFLRYGKSILREHANQLIKRLDLYKKRHELAGNLSYGDRKILDLAIALACQPKVLLMDEPTQGISIRESKNLLTVVKKISIHEGITVIFTEHDLDVIKAFPSRVILLNEGKIVMDDKTDIVTSSEIFKNLYERS